MIFANVMLLAVFVGLMLLGTPIAVALGLSSTLFLLWFSDTSLASIAQSFYQAMAGHYTLLAIPFFILASAFMSTGGVARRIIRFSIALVGHLPGGLAIAGVFACMLFAALSGSSPATVVAIGSIVIVGMREVGYTKDFAAGVIAVAGTLGILIPPSVILVIYAILAEQNIAKLVVAALIPGLLAALGYILAISIWMRVWPNAAAVSPRVAWPDRLKMLGTVWPVVAIFAGVVGGIYGGIFTPTEAAAVGAAGTGLIAWSSGQMSWGRLQEAILSTASSTAMIFFIILAAGIYNNFLSLTQLPQSTAAWVGEQGFSPWLVLTLVLLMYLLFGCIMDSLSMVLLTVPIVFPIVSVLDFGMSYNDFGLWFGILVLIVVEVGLITPPVGLNLFIINNMAKTTPISETYRGALPFVVTDLIRVVFLTCFPSITLWLVWVMGG